MAVCKNNQFQVKIPVSVFQRVQDDIVWNVVSKFSVKHLIKKISDVIRNKEFRLKFHSDKSENGLFGSIMLYGLGNKHKMEINSWKTRISQLPSVLIHEVLHAIFPQLEDDRYILELEFKVMRSITTREVNRLMKLVFQKIDWSYSPNFERRVESEPRRKRKRTSKTKKNF